MGRVRKRVYIATIAIIAGLWALAFYANEQTKELAVEFHEQLPIKENREIDLTQPPPAPLSTTTETQTPADNSKDSPTPPPTSKPKVKTIFIDINQFQSTVPEVVVDKGYKVNLIFKTTKATGATGLNVSVPQQNSVLIGPGETSEITFMATEDFNIAVSEETAPTKTLYIIKVNVK